MEKMIIEGYNIKGMICSRCLKVLKNELTATGAEVKDMQLGWVQVSYNAEKVNRSTIKKIILENDFDILEDKESILADQTKQWVINYIWETDQSEHLSDFLTEKTQKSYQVVSRNFSKIFGQTLERYYTRLKMERVKEWIEFDEMNFSQMAYTLGYQNSSALSRQFKKEIRMTMKAYKELNRSQRIPLNEL